MNQDELIQNLRDAGCGEETVSSFLLLFESGESAKAKMLLARHRKELLDGIHREERKIGCLDYLVYEMNRSV